MCLDVVLMVGTCEGAQEEGTYEEEAQEEVGEVGRVQESSQGMGEANEVGTSHGNTCLDSLVACGMGEVVASSHEPCTAASCGDGSVEGRGVDESGEGEVGACEVHQGLSAAPETELASALSHCLPLISWQSCVHPRCKNHHCTRLITHVHGCMCTHTHTTR